MLQKVETPIISRQSAHEGDNVVCHAHRPLLSQETFLVLLSVRGWVDLRAILRPEGLCQRKIPITPIGCRTPTFRLVAQGLNQMRHRVPPSSLWGFNAVWWTTPFLWIMTPCQWVTGSRRFEWIQCFHLQRYKRSMAKEWKPRRISYSCLHQNLFRWYGVAAGYPSQEWWTLKNCYKQVRT